MACLYYGGMELGGALAHGGRMDFAEPDAAPNYGPDRSIRIQHMALTLRMDPVEKHFSGTVSVEFDALPDFDGIVVLDCDDVSVTKVLGDTGEPLDYVYSGGTLEIDAGMDAGSVSIFWTGCASGRGMYFTGPEAWAPERQHMAWTQCQDEDGHFVFPCHDHPRQKWTWSIRLEAPSGYTLLSNGQRCVQGEEDGWGWATFEQKEPMPAYLFTAVAAKLSCVESEWRGRSVRYFVPVGEEEAVIRSMGKTPLMLEHFSGLTGVDYPWPRYDQVVVHDFVFGGMENTACTTMTDLLLVPDNAIEHWDPDGLVAHELAHQWFGDFVTCQDWSQGWLNESWATFMETQWWEHDRTQADATWYRYTQARGYWGEDSARYRRPIVSYRFKEPIDVFDAHLYQKGSCVLSTLRHELGDVAFWAGVKQYLTSHQFDTVHTRHFQRAMELESGRNLDGFFEQWIFSPGHPDLKVDLQQRKGLLLVDVTQTQKGDEVPEEYRFTLYLEVVFDDGTVQAISLPVENRKRTFALPISGAIQTVRVDPEFRVLATLALSAPTSWLEALLYDACPVLACRAAKALLKKDGVRPFQAVLKAFRDSESTWVRVDLAAQVGKRGGDEAEVALTDALQHETEPKVALAIVSAMKPFRSERVFKALKSALENEDLTLQLRARILVGLGMTRQPEAVALIKPYLSWTSWASCVQSGALTGLSWTEDASVFELLASHTTPDHDARVRAAAARAVGTLADKNEMLRPKAAEVLLKMLTQKGFREILAAISTLASLREQSALGVLRDVHSHAADGRVRRSAYEAMVVIQRGRSVAKGLDTLRSRMDTLTKENQKLRSRIDKLVPEQS